MFLRRSGDDDIVAKLDGRSAPNQIFLHVRRCIFFQRETAKQQIMMTLLIQCTIARRVLQKAIANFAGATYRDEILRRLRGFIRGTAKFKVGFLHRKVLQFVGKRHDGRYGWRPSDQLILPGRHRRGEERAGHAQIGRGRRRCFEGRSGGEIRRNVIQFWECQSFRIRRPLCLRCERRIFRIHPTQKCSPFV